MIVTTGDRTMTMDSLQADKGEDWQWARALGGDIAPLLLEAMHDRDRFQRERDWEREQRG